MKVLWLSHVLPYPPTGGVVQRAHHLLTAAAAFSEIDLVAFHQRALHASRYADPAFGERDAVNALSKLCASVQVESTPIDVGVLARYRLAAMALVRGSAYSVEWFRSQAMAERVARTLGETDYDLLHVDTLGLLLFRHLFPSDTPIVLDHHNVESQLFARRARKERSPALRRYYEREGRRLRDFETQHCNDVTLNLTCSALDGERLQRVAPYARTRTIPNPVDVEYFELPHATAPLSRDAAVLFVGTMSWYPNQEAAQFLANEVSRELQALSPAVGIDLVGPHPPEALTRAAMQAPNVRIHGFVDDIRPMMQWALAFVCPIMDGGGTKLKLLDAMAASMAIVAHPVACEGIGLVDEETVLLAESARGFAEQCVRLACDSTLRNRLGAAARNLAVSHYSIQSVGDQLYNAYQSALSSRPERPSGAGTSPTPAHPTV